MRERKRSGTGSFEPAFVAELGQETTGLRAECERTGTPLTRVAETIFDAADEDPDPWTHAEAIAAWALQEPRLLHVQ